MTDVFDMDEVLYYIVEYRIMSMMNNARKSTVPIKVARDAMGSDRFIPMRITDSIRVMAYNNFKY